jgi:hypothetical protein
MTSPFLLFMHIPKAAGTTLRSILDLQYGRKNVITYYNQPNEQLLENLDYLLRAGRHDYKALVGHFNFGVHEKLTRPASYITFLRDPVSRAISSYYENLTRGEEIVFGDDGARLSLSQCLDRSPEYFANQHLKMLIGRATMHETDRSDLENCINNMVEHFSFVGITEYFNASILLLSKQLQWRPCQFGNMNLRKMETNVEDADVTRLIELNQLDLELYEHWCEVLLNRMRRAGRSFDLALGNLTSATKDVRADDRSPQEANELTGLAPALSDYLDMPAALKAIP